MELQDLYARTIRPLPATARRRLAALILDDLPSDAAAGGVTDDGDEWTSEDFADFTASGWNRLDAPDALGEAVVKRNPADA